MADQQQSSIEKRAKFDSVRYANCWEDADVLCAALRPRPGDRILSISSAGDNSLALLGEGASVVAADLNATQLACLELRAAGFRRLTHSELLELLGVRPCPDRGRLYSRIESDLSEPSRQHWNLNPQNIQSGVIHCGRFESYFRLFRRRVLPLIHRRKIVEQLLFKKSPEQQREFYDRTWDNWRWQFIFRIFFGRLMLGHVGRDPEFMRYVEGSVGSRLLSRVRHGLREVPTHSNPYLTYILTGNFGDNLPRYLRPENFEAIREGIDRLTIFHGSIDQAALNLRDHGFNGFNLSDIFEYLDPETSRNVYRTLISAGQPEARCVYWNTLVPRRCAADFVNQVRPLQAEATRLHAIDQAFFYCDFVIDELVS